MPVAQQPVAEVVADRVHAAIAHNRARQARQQRQPGFEQAFVRGNSGADHEDLLGNRQPHPRQDQRAREGQREGDLMEQDFEHRLQKRKNLGRRNGLQRYSNRIDRTG